MSLSYGYKKPARSFIHDYLRAWNKCFFPHPKNVGKNAITHEGTSRTRARKNRTGFRYRNWAKSYKAGHDQSQTGRLLMSNVKKENNGPQKAHPQAQSAFIFRASRRAVTVARREPVRHETRRYFSRGVWLL